MKILIVDDSVTSRKVARSLFEGNGLHHIVEAESGIFALDILKQNKDFDLILTDINMPNLNGLDMAKKLNHYGLKVHRFL
ncbi:MAG: response regulator [Campylobacterota bacterium]|nr:response regulator [Campylobacterota bacterium]